LLPGRSISVSALSFLLVGFSLFAACTNAPVMEPQAVAPSLPSHFTTYTADSGVFSISYPSDWEVPMDLIAEMKEATVDLFQPDITPELAEAVRKANMVFVAGAKTESGYNPNVNVTVQVTEHTSGSLDKLIDISEQEFRQSVRDFQEVSRTKAIVDGHDALIVEFQYAVPAASSLCHSLLMTVRAKRSMWFVTCTVLPPLEFGDVADDFSAVLQSLRLDDAA